MGYTITKEATGKVLLEHTTLPPRYLPCGAITQQTDTGVDLLNSDYKRIARFEYDIVDVVDNGTTQISPVSPSELFNALKLVFKCGGTTSLTTDSGNYSGAIDYADTSTTASPIDISTSELNLDTWVDVPNNGLGAGSTNTITDSPDIMDLLTGYLYFSEIAQGAKIEMRIDLNVTTLSPNTVVRCRLLQAVGDALEKEVVFAHRFFKKARTLDSYVFTTTFDVTSDAFYLNPTKIQIMADDTCAIINNGVRFWITQ